MVGYNRIILVGNLTKDPELRHVPSGTAVCTLRLAVNRRYRQENELKDEVCYVDVVAWGKQAESCNDYLSKGRAVLVEGRLVHRTWETEGGESRSKHEVVANTVRFLPRAEGRPDSEEEKEQGVEEEGVPF